MSRARTSTALLVAAALAGCSHSPGKPDARASASPTPSPVAATSAPSPRPVPTKPTPSRTPARVVAQSASSPTLIPFTSCTDLLARMKREALSQVGPWGLPGSGGMAVADGRAAAMPTAAEAGSAAPAAPGFSGTNNQEAGVDEADLVKTDGRLLAVMRQQTRTVQLVDLTGSTPRKRGHLTLPQSMYDGQLLLIGRRLVVLGSGSTGEQDQYRPKVTVLVVSLADLDEPRVEREFTVEGWMSAAREVGGRVFLVAQSNPDVVWAYPREGTREAERRAKAENRRRVLATKLDSWLPSIRNERTGRTYRPACSDGLRAQQASGTATTTLVSLDPASDVPGQQAVVEGSGSIVYASTRSVYVTTWPWEAQVVTSPVRDESDITTSVHRFDISEPASPRYTGSGSVPGTLIGQYAMSEHDGHLRVASTVGRTWAQQGEDQPPSDNVVSVLKPVDQRLVQVGVVKGLGRGERIYGVRFAGDLGYVVTFRQTDPLYVLDLSDPTRPVARGELHITGYSSYLHPLGGDLLLGLGQEVDPKSNQRQGTQLSAFDVSDPTRPRLRSRQVFPAAWSAAEGDPHALLWWPATRLVVMPLMQQQAATEPSKDTTQHFEGAVAMRVDRDGSLHELARIAHPQSAPSGNPRAMECCWGGIQRSVVVGDDLLTLSERGIMTSELDTLEERAWLSYA